MIFIQIFLFLSILCRNNFLVQTIKILMNQDIPVTNDVHQNGKKNVDEPEGARERFL